MQIWNFLVSIAGACLADLIGRRSLWLTSLAAMICSNIGIAITSAVFDKSGADAATYMAILFLFLYNAGFNIACNPLAYSYPTEILPYSMRTKGLAVMVAIGQALLIVTLEELASLFEDDEALNMMEKMEGIEPEVETIPVEREKKE